jgi:hypothetical protein
MNLKLIFREIRFFLKLSICIPLGFASGPTLFVGGHAPRFLSLFLSCMLYASKTAKSRLVNTRQSNLSENLASI